MFICLLSIGLLTTACGSGGGSSADNNFGYIPTIPTNNTNNNVTITSKNVTLNDEVLQQLYELDIIETADKSKLTSINIPSSYIYNNTQYTITAIGDYCFAIKNNKNIESKNISQYIENTALKEITIPDSITSIGDGAFFDCINLESIELPDSIISIGNEAFSGCTSLESINIPENILEIAKYLFEDCISLVTIELPDGVTNIEDGAFSGCTSLENINIPDSVIKIGKEVFADCISLIAINLPEGLTSIGEGSFSGCTSLENVNIPDSVKDIGENAFYNVKNVKYKGIEYIGNAE